MFLMPHSGYGFMSELDGELFFSGREDHICDNHSNLWDFFAGGKVFEVKTMKWEVEESF